MRYHTTREVADQLGIEEWRVRRLYETGTLKEPARFAGKRAIPAADVPQIVAALQARGWLPTDATPTATGAAHQ